MKVREQAEDQLMCSAESFRGVVVVGRTWVEQVGFVPELGVVVNRPHVDQNTSPTTDGATPNTAGEGSSMC